MVSLSAKIIVVISTPAPASLGRNRVHLIKVGRIRPARIKLGAGRPNPLAAGLRLAHYLILNHTLQRCLPHE